MELRSDYSLCAPVSSLSMIRRSLAGLPATIALAGTFLVTTLPAPTMAFSPITTWESMVAPDPIEAPVLTIVCLHSPIRLSLQCTSGVGGPGIGVVDEHDSVANEDVVLDGHSFTDESVAGNLAVASDDSVLLHFNECADLRTVSNFASIEVDKARESVRLSPASRRGRCATCRS